MAVTGQSAEMFAGNIIELTWNEILAEGGDALIDLTGRIVKFALTRKNSAGVPNYKTPLLDFSSDDVDSQVVIGNATTGNPHVTVTLLPADTALLAPKDTTFYCELEVFEDDPDENPVVVATLDLLIKANVVNE
jgi:hypothetical protein